MQVHPHGLRHIRSDKRVNEWRAPGRRTITKAATNERQVVIALSGGECIYFEQDTMGQLVETEKKEMSGDVACLDVGPVPEGRQRSRFLAVGSYDNTVSCLPCVLVPNCHCWSALLSLCMLICLEVGAVQLSGRHSLVGQCCRQVRGHRLSMDT